MTTTHKIVYYVLKTLMSLGFIFAAIPKLMGDPMAVAGFAQAHLPVWFMYFIGCAEIAGAIGLWIPKLQRYATYGLFIVLTGAIVTTIIFVSAPMALLPAVYAIILGFILWSSAKKKALVQNQ
jgi:uncharacterized membrane protein YphA (DoxX/SURF4 family)